MIIAGIYIVGIYSFYLLRYLKIKIFITWLLLKQSSSILIYDIDN